MNRILLTPPPFGLRNPPADREIQSSNLSDGPLQTKRLILGDKVEPYRYQLAGHPRTFYGSLTGKYVYKITSLQEIKFYISILEQNSRMKDFCKHIPVFGGVYLLSDGIATEIDLENGIDTLDSCRDSSYKSIRLENLLLGIKNPSYADLKLGNALYCCCVSEQKRERMILRSLETTSHEMSLRISGFCKWNGAIYAHKEFTKAEGYLLTRDTIFPALADFFTIDGESFPRRALLLEVLRSLLSIRDVFLAADLMLRSTSLFIAYGNTAPGDDLRVVVKVIDFARSHTSGRHEYGDGGFLIGINNLMIFLQRLISSSI